MKLKLKRLGGSQEEPYCVEIRNYWPDSTMILIHLERLPDIRIFSKASSAMTDDVQIEFSYKGYPFIITSPYSYLWVSANSSNVPEPIFEEVISHLENYKSVWPHHFIFGMLRHLKLPRWKR